MANENATRDDWLHADLVLGLSADLLPVAPADSPPAHFSAVKKFGKVPSELTDDGHAYGLKGWQGRVITPEAIEQWSRDPRLSICVRASAVRAIDVDITDATLAARIKLTLAEFVLGSQAVRWRENSSKFLLPFRTTGSGPIKKRVIDCGEHGRIELLADGQQWLLAGAHPSGVRYRWAEAGDRLPDDIRIDLSLATLDQLWSELAKRFEVNTKPTTEQSPPRDPAIEPNGSGAVLTSIPDGETYAQVKSALEWPALKEAADENSLWAEIGYALLSLGRVGRDMFFHFERGGGAHENTAASWWEQHATQTPRSDFRHIFTLARKYGWKRELPSADAFPITSTSQTPSGARVEADGAIGEASGAPSDEDTLLPPAPDKPIIKLTGGRLHENIDQSLELLDIYSQGQGLVRFGTPSDLGDQIRRDPHARPLVRATPEFIRVELTRVATIMKFDGRSEEWVVVDCPKAFAEDIIGQKVWPAVRPLTAVVRAPFMRADGSICSDIGYDALTGVMYVRSMDFPPVPERPTLDDAYAALEMLKTPFDQFPLTPASRSAFLANILTEAARTAMPTAPMFWYSAADASTGKTLLAEMPARLVHDSVPAERPWVDDEELRKTLYAMLLSGERSIHFDNLTQGAKFRSPILCSYLTAPVVGGRTLGVSEDRKLPNCSVVSATGNNVTPASDLARRSLVIRMDANMPSYELAQRKFKIPDLRSYIHAHRPELLIAALTILRAHQLSGHRTERMLPSFEDWSRIVRDSLVWLDQADPLESQKGETNNESDGLGGIFQMLSERIKRQEFTARDVVTVCERIFDPEGTLPSALIASGCSDPTNVVKVGYWLRGNRDRVAAGLKLVVANHTKTGAAWSLVSSVNVDDLL